MADAHPSNHGGARPGAGRKPHAPKPAIKSRLTSNFVPGTPGPPSTFFSRRNGNARSTGISATPVSEANYSSFISEDEYTQLKSEWETVQELDCNEGSGDADVDESLFDDEDFDDLLTAMNKAESETNEDDTNLKGVHEEYLRGIVDKLKGEIQKSGQPQCYQKGTFWINPRDPLFALHATKTRGYSPTELYHLPIFVWLPDCLPGRPDYFYCKNCNHKHHLVRNGWNYNPIARRVRDLHGDYFLLTGRFVCKKNTVNNEGCGTSYQGTDPNILMQLPRHVQESFPAYITARAAIDKKLMGVMRTLFASRFGPEPFASLLGEMRHLQHARLELTYLATCATMPHQAPPVAFSSFDDRNRYAGTHPSLNWCKSIFVEWMRAHRVFLNRVMASLPGQILKGDHTFKLIKNMARLSGQPSHEAIYTVVNEWEEARGQALTLTKSLSYVSEMYEEIARGLQAHGHHPTELMFSDNAAAELGFHESTTTSLSEDVVHIEPDPYQHLPPLVLLSDPIVYDSPDLIDEACLQILERVSESPDSRLVVGFGIKYELETTGQGGPGAVPMAPRHQLDVIQIAVEHVVYVFQVSRLKTPAAVPPCLRALLTHSQIIKSGYSVRADLQRIADVWSLSVLQDQLRNSDSNVIELSSLARLKGKASNSMPSLAALSGLILQKRITKSDSIRCSRWSNLNLSQEQITYAATDAYACWCIWKSLSCLPSVGQHITSEHMPGQLVTLHSGKKAVALGTLMDAPDLVSVPPLGSNDAHKIHVTPSRTVIRIDKVLIPGHIVALYHETLETLSHEIIPFHIVVSRSTLRTLSAELQSSSLPPNSRALRIVLPARLNHEYSGSSEVESDSDSESVDLDSDSDSDADLEPELEQNACGKALEILKTNCDDDSEFDDEDINEIIRTIDLDEVQKPHSEPAAASMSSGSQSILHQPEMATKPFPSRVLEDLWHVQDRLLRLLSKKHSGFKAFARAFSETLLVRDEDDVAAVAAVYEQRGYNWESALRSNADKIRRRIRRYCPPPERLVPDLIKLFSSWKNVQCSNDPSRPVLFSAEAVKQAAQIVKHAERGFLSDPDGFPMYRKIGTDPDGLNIYRSLRGTNSIEGGIHMPLRRTFGSLRASPELADHTLSLILHRRNTSASVGSFNRTGKKYRSHFDTWMSDEIVEIAAQVGIKPSFPIPNVLSTRIATNETMGIIRVPVSLAASCGMSYVENPVETGTPNHRDIPVHRLTHFSTARVNVYEYLRQRQQTLHAVTPLHLPAEFSLYNELLKTNKFFVGRPQAPAANHTTKTINFEKLARRWNEVVHERPEDKLFYKIPQQLERHHKVWAAYRAEKATLSESVQARKEIINLLDDPTHRSRVLPARSLPGSNLLQAKVTDRAENDVDCDQSDTEYQGRTHHSDTDTTNTKISSTTPTVEASAPTSSQDIVQSQSTANVAIPAIQQAATQTVLTTCPSIPDAGLAPVGRSNPRKRRAKRCAACRDHNCPRVDDCKGSGGQKFCPCTSHAGPKNPRKRTKL
ncbi:hypothetical protein H0H93_001463 [Arthromyces matolae]|nr:hypothetical protein H0H93_001463 [Arthromyces matolae]